MNAKKHDILIKRRLKWFQRLYVLHERGASLKAQANLTIPSSNLAFIKSGKEREVYIGELEEELEYVKARVAYYYFRMAESDEEIEEWLDKSSQSVKTKGHQKEHIFRLARRDNCRQGETVPFRIRQKWRTELSVEFPNITDSIIRSILSRLGYSKERRKK